MQSSDGDLENRSQGRAWIPVALCGGLLVRLVGYLTLKSAFFCGIPAFDDAIHRLRAFEILHGGWPESVLPWGSPLYPYVAALISAVTGEKIAGILLVQCLVGLALPALVAWALAPVLSPRSRWIAAFIYAINPIGVFLEMRLQPTVLAVGLLLVSMRLLFFGDLRRWDRAVLGGLAAGVGFLLQPLIFAALGVAGVWVRLRQPHDRAVNATAVVPPRLGAVTLAIGFLILPVLVCALNSTLVRGGPAWNWSGAVAFHRAIEPGSWGTVRSPQPPAYYGPRPALADANEAAGRELTEWELARHHLGQGLRLVAERPLEFVRTVLTRAVLLLSAQEIPDPASPSYVLQRNAPVLGWGLRLFPLWLAFAALGFWQLRDEGRLSAIAPPVVALGVANLLGLQSCATRWPLVIASLPAIAVGLQSVPSRLRAALGHGGPRYVLPAAMVLCLLSALDLPQARTVFGNPSEDLRYEAGLVLRAQDRRGAISRLRGAITANPQNAMAHTELASLLMQEELPQAARAEYDEALRIDPESEAALYGLSEVLRTREMYAEAESVATQLLALHPSHPLYLNQLGAILMLQGSLPRARALFERALEISPNYQVALINLRTVQSAEQQAATLAFPEGLTPPPDSELWTVGRAALQALHGGNQAAADSITARGLADHPDEVLAVYLRGACLFQLDRFEEAAAHLTRVVRAAPGRVLTTRMAARALVAAGRAEEARELIDWSRERAPDERNRQGMDQILEEMREAP